MYEVLILVSPQSSANLERLEAAVQSGFSSMNPPQRVSTSLKNAKLTVVVDGFRFFVDYSCEPHVLEESREIAEQFALQHPSRAAIATASCRFELSSEDDPEMDHFNDMVALCQAAETIGPVYIFDPQAGEFQ